MAHKLVLLSAILLGFTATASAIMSSGNANNNTRDLQPAATNTDQQTSRTLTGYQGRKELQSRPYEYVKADKYSSYERKQPLSDSRERIKSKYKGHKDNIASGSSYYEKGYPSYGGHDDPGFSYHDSGQVYGDKDISEYYNYHNGYDHREHGPFYHGGHPPVHYGQDHQASALKGLLLPLAGVALLGAAAALVSNPVLLQLGVISGKRKRRSIKNIFAADQRDNVDEDKLSYLKKYPVDRDVLNNVYSKPKNN